MNAILKFKSWQLFILIVLTGSWKSPSPLQEIINFIGLAVFLTWIYAIGIEGQKKLKSQKLPTLESKLFKINIILTPILLIVYFLFSDENTQTEFSTKTILLIPIVLYMFFAIFQTIAFSCKTISMLELQKEVKFKDYMLNFILMLFLIIGIWILQAKVKMLITKN